MIEHGSKEHTILAYTTFKDKVGGNTELIIEFLKWLNKEDKLKHLEDMEDLTVVEKGLIESMKK